MRGHHGGAVEEPSLGVIHLRADADYVETYRRIVNGAWERYYTPRLFDSSYFVRSDILPDSKGAEVTIGADYALCGGAVCMQVDIASCGAGQSLVTVYYRPGTWATNAREVAAWLGEASRREAGGD